MIARPLPRPVRVDTLIRDPDSAKTVQKRATLHERATLLAFGTESEEVRDGVLVYSVGIIELPCGSISTTPLHLIQFLDLPGWKPVTGPGQVCIRTRLRFTMDDEQQAGRVKQILRSGTLDEELIYENNKGRKICLCTSMVADGTSDHKGVEYYDERGQ